MKYLNLKNVGWLILVLKISLIVFLVLQVLHHPESFSQFSFDSSFFFFVIAGFIAQMIDGALGMAYGVSCSSLLMGFGVPPKVASASIHTAEVFTTGVSGLSHIFMKNVDKHLFIRLVIPGVIGSAIGAYLLSDVLDGKIFKPYISGYLLILGVFILIKSFRQVQPFNGIKYVSALGLTGGFFDAIGGGGWGPIVTSNIINQGKHPKETIGTVNTAEFFITYVSTGIFLFFVGIDSWKVVLGLLTGGVIAAPIGAMLVSRIKPKTIMFLVGLVVIITSCYNIYKSF